jgi:hypothetical protein
MARAGMYHHAGCLVEHEQIHIFEKNFQGNRFRFVTTLLRRRFDHFNNISGPDRITRPDRAAVSPNKSLPD